MSNQDPHGVDAPDDDIEAAASPEDFGAEPSIDALVRMMQERGTLSGWSGMDNPGAVMRKVAEDQEQVMREEAALFRRVFDNDDGRKVLEIFLDRTLRQTSWPWEVLQTRDALLAYGLAREAQNGFVAAILQAVAYGQSSEPMKGRNDGL